MTEKELARAAAHCLAIIRHAQEVTGNVSMTCRYFGIRRQAFYKWLRRYEEQGVEGSRDRSRRPRVIPHQTKPEVVEQDRLPAPALPLRTSQDRDVSAKRYHDIEVSPSGVWRILKRLDMSRLPASQRYRRHVDRWKRYEKPLPGHRVQIDVKFIAPLQGSRKKHYQFTAIDDCTRIRVLRIYDRLNQQSAIRFLDYVLEKLPFQVEVIQTDHGAEFGSQFHYHVLDRGIGHVYIKPATPRLNGKVERSHRIDAEEFYRMLDGVVIDDTGLFNTRLKEWEDFYNFHRPHGALDGQTPYERLREKTRARA